MSEILTAVSGGGSVLYECTYIFHFQGAAVEPLQL